MKKLLSLFTALSMLTSLPISSVYAENEESSELKKLASSLGADTDYLAVANQFYYNGSPSLTTGGYYYKSCIPVEEYIETEEKMAAYSDTSFGLSVMEILTHNGLISAGNIKAGADSLNQINNVSDIKETMLGYQNLLEKNEFELYRNYLFQSTSAAEKIDILCETAEKCMNEGKYFLIMYGSCCINPSQIEIDSVKGEEALASSMARKEHSAVGIGITDGSWTFNGKTYDKCILTLDSLSADENSSAFAEDTCIYINSETKECYMPKISDYAESDMHIVAIDDDKLLNFEGPINPTDSFDTDLSDIVFLRYIGFGKHNNIHELSYTDDSGKEVVMNEKDGYVKNYPNIMGISVKSDAFRHYLISENYSDSIDVRNINRYLSFSFADADSELYFNKDEVYKFVRKESFGITSHKEDAPLKYRMFYNEDYTGKDFTFGFSGETMDEAEFRFLDDGVVFSGGRVNFTVYSKDWKYGDELPPSLPSIAFNPSGEVFVHYNENDGFKIMTDLDKDGVFEHEVQKGDVNCDGFIDSVDAAAVLMAYAKMSAQNAGSKQTVYADNLLSDFNGDGFIDSVDATLILKQYAELSTT